VKDGAAIARDGLRRGSGPAWTAVALAEMPRAARGAPGLSVVAHGHRHVDRFAEMNERSVAFTEAIATLAGFCTVAGPAVAAGAVTAMPALRRSRKPRR